MLPDTPDVISTRATTAKSHVAYVIRTLALFQCMERCFYELQVGAGTRLCGVPLRAVGDRNSIESHAPIPSCFSTVEGYELKERAAFHWLLVELWLAFGPQLR
jgi:hypothetical protein